MDENYVWKEGLLYAWTGHHTASGQPVAYVQNISVNKQYGLSSRVSLGGTYKWHQTGQQIDLSINVAWTHNAALRTLAELQTGVHFKVLHTGINGSAGDFAYSGRILNLNLQGADGGAMQYSLRAQAHDWSAF